MTTDERIQQAAKKYRNWGKWGKDDQLGTLNYITPEKIVQAASLVRAGRVISLALPYDSAGPQTGAFGRVNPVHTFVLTGTDAAAGAQPFPHGIGAADDAVTMFLQCGTQWDALAHIFDYGKMWNGQDAAKVSARGASVNGIEKMAEKIVSRGVLLDIARFKGTRNPGAGLSGNRTGSDRLRRRRRREGRPRRYRIGSHRAARLLQEKRMGHLCRR